MSKPKTDTELADQLDADLTWRIRELSTLKNAIASATLKHTLLRSLIPMLYAHWEGFIKFSAQKYLDYIALRKPLYKDLELQIYVNRFLLRLDALHRSRIGIEERCQLVKDILDSQNQRFSRYNTSLIDTRSNLNSEVLKEICIVCAIDFTPFATESTFIDVILLKRRNLIAHGEEIYVESHELDGIVTKGIALMRLFSDAIQNKVYTQSYRR
jgi:hypothetical protein